VPELMHEMHANSPARPGYGGDNALADLATRQYVVVSRRQLLELGLQRGAIAYRIKQGRLHPLHSGVYLLGHRQSSQRARWLAAVLACGEGALLSYESAAAIWGLQRPRSTTHVTSPLRRRGSKGTIVHEGRLHSEECTNLGPIPVTSVARTLFDYAEVVDFHRLEHAWEEADRLKLLRLGEVERVCERGYGRRALKPIRRLLAEARAATRVRSPLEERFQDFAAAYDLPPRSTNVSVLGREVDVLWPAAKLIIELDSWEFHSHRAAFQRDRARDTRLLVAGYRTIRVTHDRLDREAATLAAEIRVLLRAQVVIASGPSSGEGKRGAGGG
jgi:predicted transcriptional regulator of viral defense system